MTVGQGIAVVGIWVGAGIVCVAAAISSTVTGDSEAMVIMLPVVLAATVATCFIA